MAMCPLCEKKFRDRRGLHGHFRFVHGIEYGSGRPAKKTVLTEATRDIVEKRRKGVKLVDRIANGEFEVIPRSGEKIIEWKNEVDPRSGQEKIEWRNEKRDKQSTKRGFDIDIGVKGFRW